MERAPGRMWNVGGLAVVEKGGRGRNGDGNHRRLATRLRFGTNPVLSNSNHDALSLCVFDWDTELASLRIHIKMHQSISPPSPFIPNPVSSDSDWEQWKEAFEAYLDALEGETFTHKRKFAIFGHCLGSEGRKILKYTPKVTILIIEGEGDGVEDEYETAIKSLDMRFVKCKNVTLERHKFYRRVQAEGESASNYVGALRLLAVSCDYKEFEEEMIRDQLVEKTNNKKVQEALLSTANLTLQKALEIATRIESTVSFMEQMSISEDKNPRPDGKDVLGRVDGSCRCHGFRAMERAPGRMWNAGGLAVVEKGGCGRNG
ncbi:hypothetical protein NDU88_006043 [Pleurodeles waltl]|uniref:Retrotransposon gag domain-containing protein n=1 Tax=Pleurodeles waltl TaxID=8319 RepID=A0AAV7SNP2_PLEWA|nr:hypothetical protein NDU88_006043 [Pleurodeles waltl]